MRAIEGIHHITAVARTPSRNWRFYTRVLGERLVKKTVNFDDPGSYHLYYGDGRGSPGTLATFFLWERMRPAVPGANAVSSVAYAVPETSLAFWADRLRGHGVQMEWFRRFGESGLAFADPDGLSLELLGRSAPPETVEREDGPVPGADRLRGFAAPTLIVRDRAPTLSFLTEGFGMNVADEEAGRIRLGFSGAGSVGDGLDVVEAPSLEEARLGAGAVHHIAFRARDEAHQMELRDRVKGYGLKPTGQIDRTYFQSVYFREPGGILFEIATDAPGFTRDEALSALGSELKLPPQHEQLRERLERTLPPVGGGGSSA